MGFAIERRTRLISEREKKIIAYHEGGHALVAYLLPNADPVHKISVIPRGRALGYTLTLPLEDKFLMLHRYFQQRGELVFTPSRVLRTLPLEDTKQGFLYFVGKFRLRLDDDLYQQFPGLSAG